ncbi:Protein PALE CRESS, chloroplastic [Cucurbita argyrosperma subsp. argyrosperma]|nr:Protein PALE CRESS, chloroplastic [Cucurbita argyrosperma subsp. argyrosperma]
MLAQVRWLRCSPVPPLPSASPTLPKLSTSYFLKLYSSRPVLRRSLSKEEPLIDGLPKEYYDDVESSGCLGGLLVLWIESKEWQARQREKTKELHRRRQEEDEEEERKVEEYREIGMRLKGFPEEDVIKARKLKIEEAAEKGELTELVLLVIWNRLDLARRDDEKDAIRSLDLLYRRVETEILKREASPAMRLLNDLLNMYDNFNDEGWLKDCRKRMIDTFPREDPFSILVPAGFDIDKHQGQLRPSLEVEADNTLLRVDFVREVDELLQEVRADQSEVQNANADGFDAESVASRLKQQEKQRTVRLVETLLELAMNLEW